MLKYMYLWWAKVQKFSSTASKLGSLTLKPSALKDVYFLPVASESIEGRILCTNQLQNIDQLINTNQYFL